jgi:glycosyltransferase 2 family protein
MLAGGENKVRSRIFFVVTNLISLLFLVWALHGLSWSRLRHDVIHLDFRWVAVGLVADVLVYFWQGWRWSLVLRPIQAVSSWQATRSIYVGMFANEVLPLRAGELIRCFLQAKSSDIPVSVVLASALIERIFDGFWLILGLLITVRYVRLPRQIVFGAVMLGILLLICGVLMAIAMFWKQQALDRLLDAKWLGWVHVLIEDLHLIGHSRYLYYAWLASLPYLLIQVIPIYAFMQAYLPLKDLHIGVAFTVMVILRLVAVIPQAPGNLGAYNAFTVVGLRIFLVPSQTARSFSLMLWTGITAPLLLVGFIALAATGLDMGELHKQARAGVRKKPQPAGPVTP